MYYRRYALMSAMALAAAVVAGAAPAVQAQSPAERFSSHAVGSTAVVDHSAWDRLLKTYVVPGADGVNRVDYAKFKKEGASALKAYLAALEKVDVGKLDRPEQFAFWANLYNAATIDAVLGKYPVKSIKDVSLGGGLKALVGGGPWQAKILKVGDLELSLDDVEHGILRPVFKDPRVHYSVNCASFGCPNLPVAAFTGATLEAMLDAGARAYVNHPRGIRIEGGKATGSSIYSWFQSDFGGSDKSVRDHLRKFAAPELKQKLDALTSITSYDYDWSLNDIKK